MTSRLTRGAGTLCRLSQNQGHWWQVWLVMLLIDLPGISWLVLRWTAPDEPEYPVG